jgi:ferrochelatase
VRGGGPVPDELVEEFRRRYDRIGRSPLIEVTLRQAALVEEELERRHGRGAFAVAVGMLHSDPRVDAALSALRDRDVREVTALVLAPQYSPLVLAGYERAVERQRAAQPEMDIRIAPAWHLTPAWIDSLAERLRDALLRLPAGTDAGLPVIFTAHSLPRAVVERDPGYIDQLRATAEAAARRAGLAAGTWRFAYQSAGHTPEEWLKPDVKDLLPGLHEEGMRDVLVVPVQFLADHLEILYDIDVAAREEAAAFGIRLHRIELPNTMPAFITALADVVDREAAGALS